MNTYILRILFQCLLKWISSLARWNKDIAVSASSIRCSFCITTSIFCTSSFSNQIITHINFNGIFSITPFSSIQVTKLGFFNDFFSLSFASFCVFTSLIGSCIRWENVSYLLVSLMIFLCVKEHVFVINGFLFFPHEHLGSSFSFLSSQIDHWPTWLLQGLILSKDGS